MPDDQSNRKPAPIGGVESKSPADRIRQIQEMQAAVETAPVRASAPPAPAAPVAATAGAQIGDAFAVVKAALVKDANIVNKEVHATYGKVQADVSKLFGGKNEIEIKGEPWKVISFLDAAPAIFEPKKPLAQYEPVVAKKGVVTPHGLHFEVGLKSKDGSEPLQKKQVLVGQDGQLRGAQVSTPQDLDRLLRSPGFFLRATGLPLPQGLQSKESTQARFEVKLPGSRSASIFFNNFGQKVPASSSDRFAHDFAVRYNLDAFDAGL